MIKIRELESGIRIVMEEIPYVQSVSLGIWVKTGAVDEQEKNSGVSHFIEHMMFKGTEKRTSRQIAEDIDKIGGQINAFTGKEATCYYVKTLYNNFEKGADVLVDMLTESCFDKKEMDKERQVICEEIKMTLDSPEDLVHDTITSQVFKGNALGKSIIGTPTSLKNITRNAIKKYLEEEYTRDNIVISVAGKIDEEKICQYFEDKLLTLAPKKETKETVLMPYEKSFKVITKDIEQTHICLGTKGIKTTDDRYYAFSILNNIMGGSMSSRFFQNIREEKGLAYSVYSMSNSFSNDGYYNIYAGVSHNKIKDAINGIKEELVILDKSGVTKEELETSKEQMKGSYIFSQESVAGRMFAIGKNIALLDRVYTLEDVIKGIDDVTMEDVEEAKKIICDIDNYSAVVVSDKKTPLRKIMEG